MIKEYLFGSRVRRGTLLVCLAHLAFFTALFLTYFYQKATTADWPTPFHFGSLLMAAGMSMFSIAASITAVMSHIASREKDKEPAVRWMAIAIACWIVFLFLEIVEWIRLVFMVELGWTSQFGQIFLAITGAHFLCIFACMMWMAVCAAGVGKRDLVAVGIYSHFLNVIWASIVFLIYFGNADLYGL